MIKYKIPQLNMATKLVLFLLLVSVLPLLILGIISYNISQTVIQNDVSKYTEALMIEHKDHLEALLESVESLIANISGIEDIKIVLDDEQLSTDTYTRLATHAKIGYILNGYLNLNGLVSIDIFTLGGSHYHVGDTLNVEEFDQTIFERLYTEVLNTNNLVLWTGVENNINVNSTYKKVVTAAKLFTVIDADRLQEKPIALLLINYSTDSLYDHFSKFDLGEGSYMIIVDAKNRLIFHPDKKSIGLQIAPSFLQKLTANNGAFISTVEGEEMLITYSKSEMSNWFLISLVPVASLTTSANTIRNTTILVLFVCFLFISIAAIFVSRTMVTPIGQITDLFIKIQKGSYDGKTRFNTTRTDEIGKLLQWFNTFLNSLEAKQQAELELIKAKETAEAANEEITILNNRLEADNNRLEKTLNDLLITQQELIQSEKMAALGQLIAGIAHEINTPLGAIQASIGNISDAMNKSLHQLPHLLAHLSMQQQTEFFTLLEITLEVDTSLSFKEQRRLKRSLKKILIEDYNINNVDQVAATLVMLGLNTQHLIWFTSLLQAENNSFILQVAYQLVSQRIHSQNIEAAIERVSKIVFALKSYAHYDYSGKKLYAQITDSLEVILTLYHNWLKQGIEVIKHYETVPEILCYPDELNQVWTNLIHNAIQAMNGKGQLEISVLNKEVSADTLVSANTLEDNNLEIKPGTYIIVNITDNGPGIPDEIKPRIFDAFFTTKPAGEGSGLGLEIVRRIIDKHDGKINVESEVGCTTFSVWLPVNLLLEQNQSEQN